MEHQTISVPFLWEEKPGKPRRDWAAKPPPPAGPPPSSLPSPAKLFAPSVPFKWEDEPGKPADSNNNTLPQNNPFVSSREEADAFRSYLEAFGGDAPSQHAPAAPLAPSSAAGEGGSAEWDSESETSADDEGGGSSSSSEGSAAVEQLQFVFPLATSPEGARFVAPVAASRPERRPSGNSNYEFLVSRTPTLGELILLSRKLYCGSAKPRPVHDHTKQQQQSIVSSEFTTRKAFACF